MATAVFTSDGLAHTGPCDVKSVSFRAGATGGAFQLNDSLADGGTDVYSGNALAASPEIERHFNPPLHCYTGLFVDVPGTNVTVQVSYEPKPV